MDGFAQRRVRMLGTCAALFFCGLSLTAYSAKNPNVSQIGTAVVSQLLYPFQSAYRAMTQGAAERWHSYVRLVGVKEENELLREKVELLEARAAEANELETENEKLRGLVGMGARPALKGVAANVIAFDPSNWVRAVTVDKGMFHGVRPGMPVLHVNGVVGQVTSVSTSSSRVLLITDHSSGVDALVQETRARGIVGGRGTGGCELRFVEKEFPVQEGDVVITSGLDGVYPKGIVIGTVSWTNSRSDALFHTIRVQPVVDFSRLEMVHIVTGGGEG